tara:strand:- start:42 stop:530 length:489 start_codon:yes stop_codon:yes gene_type:complete
MSTLKVGTIQDHANSTTAMTIDSGGRILQPEKPHFHVSKTDGHVGASTTVIWNNVIRDTESAYSTSTGKYTIPAGLTGVWWFSMQALANNTEFIEMNMKDGSTSIGNARNRSDSGANINASVSINIAYFATAGAEIAINTQASSSMYGTGSQYSFWTGYFIG